MSVFSNSSRLFLYDEESKLTFLIDSGADVSVIPNSIFGILAKSNDTLVAANGTPIPTYGVKFLKVSLGLRRSFPHTFVLAEVNHPIIGADFLKRYGLLVDLSNKRLVDPLTSLSTKASIAKVDTPSPKLFAVSDVYTNLLKEFPSLMEAPDFNKPIKHHIVHHIQTKRKIITLSLAVPDTNTLWCMHNLLKLMKLSQTIPGASVRSVANRPVPDKNPKSTRSLK